MRFLRFSLWAMCMAVPALGQLPPQDNYTLSTADVRKGIVAVISDQLGDFHAGNAGKAYALAAARFKAQFSSERFAALVKQSYPEIWTNTGAQFGVVRDDGVSAIVVVQVACSAGNSAAYDYFLLKENDVWRIGGVLRHGAAKPPA